MTGDLVRLAENEDSEGISGFEALGKAVQPRPDRFAAALARAQDSADIERDAEDGRARLTPRGSVHLLALQGRRNEGEDHVETLTDLSMFLSGRGIAMTIPEQVSGVLMPDGQFQWGNETYNVEVESTTLAKAQGQVVRNVRKAREAGNRVLIALPDGSGISRVLAVLDGAFPGLRLWPDGVGLVWRDEDEVFHPHRVPATEVWPFLERETTPNWEPERAGDEGPRMEEAEGEPVDTDPLVRQVRWVVRQLISRSLLHSVTPRLT